MEYHDQPLQFINNYYFHSKTESDEHYNTVLKIFEEMSYLNFMLFAATLFLSVAYFLPKINIIMQKLLKTQIHQLELKIQIQQRKECYNNNSSNSNDDSSNGNSSNKNSSKRKGKKVKSPNEVALELGSTGEDKHKKMESRINHTQDGKYQQNVYILSIFVTSACINLLLLVFHIVSYIEIFHYFSEVQSGNSSRVFVTVVTIQFVIMGGIISFGFCSLLCDDGMICASLVTTSLVVNIIYILSCYMPYMLLAFIYDPLQASATYLGLVIFTVTFYVVLCTVESKYLEGILKILKITCPCDNKLKHCYKKIRPKIKLDTIRAVLVAAVIVFFARLFYYMVTWGSFDDLKVAQHVSFPLVLYPLISLFFYKKIDADNTVDKDM